MAFRAEPGAGATGPHVCPQCPNKTFARLCDLNKHAKSHSRPYKCKEPGCKYGTLGWPTAKELERHHNDKHSASPRTYPCLFQPCTYWSKRESNCKQHMEKAHSWVYVRSKSKGKRLAEWGYDTKAFEEPTTAEHKPSVASIPLQTSVVSQPGLDFILFDDDQADAIGEDDDSLESAESYLPWTSPSTRLRRNEQFIEMFSQTYDAHLDKSSEMTPRSIQGYLQAVDHGQLVGDVAIKVESPVTVVDTNFPIKKRHNPVDRPESRPGRSAHTAYDERQPYTLSSKARQVAPAHARHRASSQSRGDRSDDGCRPKKKSKLNPAEDFTDTSMPDIFRHAHPSIYDRNRTERYSPCHTVHREISTLVRHLSRPAHRLNVTERAIHSFDVEDADFRHPRAGVCRCCWRTFHDRQAFEVHLTRRCDKVSKGKREKWRVLHDSFTPLLDPPETALPENEPAEQAGRETLETAPGRLGGSFVPDDSDLWHETGTPPTSVPSPTLFPSATFIPSNPLDVQLVSAHEHHRLQEEHQALYERHQQLERVTQALLARQLVQEKMKHRRATSPDTKSSATGTSMRSRPTRSSGDSDRDSLVLHMDSQPTDVDVHRFMDEMEVTRQSLSRMNSGLSTTSRSTIHRVPPSPPPRRAELPTHDVSGTASPPAKRTLAHRPPLPSIPDSGYGTDERRGSLGDLPSDVPQAEVSPCPPSTAEKTEFAAPPSQGVAWGDNPFHKPPSGNPPSPQHSQHASFLTDHYDDASYGMMFYQDNHSQSHSRGSPPDFTFDYSMSQE